AAPSPHPDQRDLCLDRPGHADRTRPPLAGSGPMTTTTAPAGTTMAAAAASYLAIRRALGHTLRVEGRALEAFVAATAARGESTVTIDAALAWAGAAGTPGVAARRLSLVRGFAGYLAAF